MNSPTNLVVHMRKMANSSVSVPHEPEMRRTIDQRVSSVSVSVSVSVTEIATLIWSDL